MIGCDFRMKIHSTFKNSDRNHQYGVVLHGGGGVRKTKEMTSELEKSYRTKLKEALSAGFDILKNGGSSVSAVEATIRVMEDSPLFNAGKGASFTSAGVNELDASIMNGKTLRAGGIANVKFVKNPISLARLVMEKTPHVLLVCEGALLFAKEQGVELKPTEYFYTERQWQSLQRRIEENIPYGEQLEDNNEEDKFSTVGAVALDKGGNLAAGTSTGGRVKKRPGRVGDSPIIGASTYANNNLCAVSTTGLGEKHMVLLTSKEISALMAYNNMSLREAANDVILNQLVAIGGGGGAIAIDKNCNVAMPFIGEGMYRGYKKTDEEMVVKIYRE
jgi:beta-aspartyl-peptidase (threonine type)